MKDIMPGQMLSMFSSMLPPAQDPANPVARFVADEIDELYPDNEIVGMIKTTLLDVANSDPDMVLRALVRIHNDIGEFVQGLQAEAEDGGYSE